jgi:hypothetical protein
VQELEGEKDSLEAALHSERERSAQQAIALRREVSAVQMNADEDKERTCVPGQTASMPLPVWFSLLSWFLPSQITLNKSELFHLSAPRSCSES